MREVRLNLKNTSLFFFFASVKKNAVVIVMVFFYIWVLFSVALVCFFFFFVVAGGGFTQPHYNLGRKKQMQKKKTKTSAHQITLTFNFNKDHLLQSVTCSSPFTAISLHVPNSSISLKLMSKATEIIKQRSGIWRTVMASGQLLLPHLLASP